MNRQLSRRRRVVAAALLAVGSAAVLLAVGQAHSEPSFNPRALDGAWDRPPPPTAEAGLDPTIRARPIGMAGIPDPPLKPQYLGPWKKLRADNAAAFARGEPPVTGYVKCLPDGMPAMMMAMFPLEVLQSKERVTIIEEAYNQIHRIYLDEKQIPIDDAEPGFWGHAVGHWEGNTLVANTVGIKENVQFQDVPHSDKMQVNERIRLTGKDAMEDQVTVTDPDYLTQPWAWTWHYVRKPGYKIMEYVCEDNREYADPSNNSQRLRLLPGKRGVMLASRPSTAAEQAFRQALEAQQAGRYEQAVQLLARAGSEDHVTALSMLGGQLITGRGVAPDFSSGLSLIRRATELGGAYATAVMAAISCQGLGGPSDWNAGLDLLQRSAELGYQSAQAQLRILAELSGPQPAAASWASLRQSIDLAAWRSSPAVETLSADPEIRIVPGLAPQSFCDWLISRARERLQPALVYTPDTQVQKRMNFRTNSSAAFSPADADLVVMLMQERLAVASGMDVRAMEGPQVLHYAPGQYYARHFDFMEPDKPGGAAEINRYGQRVATLLVYLNQGFESGETDFPTLSLKYKGRPGDALMFRNVDPSGAPDRRMSHAGLPPTTGEKWLFSQWVRDRRQY